MCGSKRSEPPPKISQGANGKRLREGIPRGGPKRPPIPITNRDSDIGRKSVRNYLPRREGSRPVETEGPQNFSWGPASDGKEKYEQQ